MTDFICMTFGPDENKSVRRINTGDIVAYQSNKSSEPEGKTRLWISGPFETVVVDEPVSAIDHKIRSPDIKLGG